MTCVSSRAPGVISMPRRWSGDHRDRLSRVLAYSKLQQHAAPARVATIVGRPSPEQLGAFFDARGVLAHLVASDDPLFVAEDTEQGFTGLMVVAVHPGPELMGSVWVACSAPLRGAALVADLPTARREPTSV